MTNFSPDDINRDPSSFRELGRSTLQEKSHRVLLDEYIAAGAGSAFEKFENFPKYVTRQSVARYMALYEIFKIALPVHGDIVEAGVSYGGGLFWFAQLSAALEPFNLQRRIIGFDTFSGFPDVTEKDTRGAQLGKEHKKGGYSADSLDDLHRCKGVYDANRPIGHVDKVLLVKGDACITIPEYLDKNPHTVVSMLHLDFDIYEPTLVALKHFLPRMVRGSVIIFDELNCPKWPGETLAVNDAVGLQKLRIQRFPFEPYISYAVVE